MLIKFFTSGQSNVKSNQIKSFIYLTLAVAASVSVLLPVAQSVSRLGEKALFTFFGDYVILVIPPYVIVQELAN